MAKTKRVLASDRLPNLKRAYELLHKYDVVFWSDQIRNRRTGEVTGRTVRLMDHEYAPKALRRALRSLADRVFIWMVPEGQTSEWAGKSGFTVRYHFKF